MRPLPFFINTRGKLERKAYSWLKLTGNTVKYCFDKPTLPIDASRGETIRMVNIDTTYEHLQYMYDGYKWHQY